MSNIAARNTLAGARVVMLNPPRRGKRKPEYLQWLASLARAQSDADALSVHLERGAVNLADFAWARQLNGEGMRELLQQPGYIQAGYSLLNAPVAARWQRKILDTLATYHEQHRDEPGPGRERLRRMALPMEDEALVLLLIEKMRESGDILSHHGWLHLQITKRASAKSSRPSGKKQSRCLVTSRGGCVTWQKRREPTSRQCA